MSDPARHAVTQPAPTNGAAPTIDLHPALIRGLLRSETKKLADGRVVLEFLLDVPGREPELRQILMSEESAEILAQDLMETAVLRLNRA